MRGSAKHDRSLVALFFVACAWVLSAPSDAKAEDERPPNAFETAYTALALDTEVHGLCENIAPSARTTAAFNSPGTQTYFERSRCFLYVAVKTLNPYLCRGVVEATHRLWSGDYFSRENCERLVAQGRPFNFSLSFDHALILGAMGYGDAAVSARFPNHPREPAWLDFYFDSLARSDGEFQQRLARLPDFGT